MFIQVMLLLIHLLAALVQRMMRNHFERVSVHPYIIISLFELIALQEDIHMAPRQYPSFKGIHLLAALVQRMHTDLGGGENIPD